MVKKQMHQITSNDDEAMTGLDI